MAMDLRAVLDCHAAVFKDELGLVKNVAAKLLVDPEVSPRFYRPRSVPHAMRPKIEQELQRLEKNGIIESVQFADWAAPIVPVLKRDGAVRICGDYKLTVNRAAKLDTYPLPRVDDLYPLPRVDDLLASREVFYEIGPGSCLHAGSIRGRVKEVCGD